MEQYLLGIDVGTSACKVALFTPEGRVAGSAREGYEVFRPEPGWAEQDPRDWWSAVRRAIGRTLECCGAHAGQIAGIGIGGQSWAAAAVGKNGEILANTPIWLDTRAESICKEFRERIGEDRIFEIAGNVLQPSYVTGKIIWYQRHLPQVYRKTYKILQSNGYIAYKLTGNMTQDVSQGYGFHCFDMRSAAWDAEMCRAFGIPAGILPDLYPCHAVIGKVHAKAAAETGLAAGTPVVAGGLDAACGTLGAGVIHAGETQEQGGQAGGMSICLDRYKADARLILGFHAVPNLWLLQGGTTGGGGVMRWLAREIAAHGREESARGDCGDNGILALFNDLARAVAPGSDGVVFLPYMAGERSPIWNPKAKGVYYGLDFGKTKGHLVRAAMEGVAMSLRHNLDVAEKAGAEVGSLSAVGGSANSLLWTQIKSDVTGKPIAAPESDTAAALGAAILAGVGVGLYTDFGDAVKRTVKYKRRHTPNEANRTVYERNYKIYLALYERLASLMEEGGFDESGGALRE
ncbi:MAG: FGGY-family carbohydrate kinase [Clostridiales Family XIII bacterium]|jgi:xylulokinase|nr:FGGY-family carbohydrate kinase [Clostridiales Family XIII bacterium]